MVAGGAVALLRNPLLVFTLAYVHTLWTVTLLFFKQYPKHWWYGAQQQPSVVFVFQRVSRDLLDLSMGLM